MNDNAKPGHLIQEELKERGITLQEFNDQTGLDALDLIHGRQVISVSIADRLHKFFGNSRIQWLRLDDWYRREATNV